VVVLVSGCLATRIAQAAFPGANGRVVFTAATPQPSIYTVNPDGSFLRPLAGQAYLASWSSDGAKLAFTSTSPGTYGSEISTMNADGTGRVVVVPNQTPPSGPTNAWPTWSPDGLRIVFVTEHPDFRAPFNDISVINSDGTGRRGLANNSSFSAPVWSPDGQKIAFGRQPTFTSTEPAGIWTVNADGTGLTQLRSDGSFPEWSPDGTKIAFVLDAGGISLMNADGTGTTLVPNTAEGRFPAFSPDGTKIAFSRNGDIYTINTDGTALLNLTETFGTPANGGPGTWQPLVGGGANLAAAKSASPNPVTVEDVLTYKLTARHVSGSGVTATGVTLIDNLPPSMLFLSATPSRGTCSHAGGTVTCDLGSLVLGADATVEVRVEPQAAGTITNTVSVGANEGDPVLANNSASQSSTVVNPTGAYARPRVATPLRLSLVPDFVRCAAPNASHGPPLNSPACSPAVPLSHYVTVGTPDANGKAANSVGYVNFNVMPGDRGTPADEADVGLRMEIRDVRNNGSLTDYTGELQLIVNLRITDRNNEASGLQPATVTDVPFSVTAPCIATPDDSIGSTCAIATSVDALEPGLAVEGKRAVWQLGQMRVFDGGEDGDGDTADNILFAKQGLFAP
jgi:uncharacterized repeat protein (TIGR01451 family)